MGDAGLAHLKGLGALRSLHLQGTKVTDAGLASLRALPKLREVNLQGTAVTAKGAEALRKARPGVEVRWGGS